MTVQLQYNNKSNSFKAKLAEAFAISLFVRIVSRWVNQRKSELNSAWSLEIAITEY